MKKYLLLLLICAGLCACGQPKPDPYEEARYVKFPSSKPHVLSGGPIYSPEYYPPETFLASSYPTGQPQIYPNTTRSGEYDLSHMIQDKVKFFDNWKVLRISFMDGNKVVFLDTVTNLGLLFKICIAKKDNKPVFNYSVVGDNKYNLSEDFNKTTPGKIVVNNKTYSITIVNWVSGPLLFADILAPSNLVQLIHNANNFAIYYSSDPIPLMVNLMGFDRAYKYAMQLFEQI